MNLTTGTVSVLILLMLISGFLSAADASLRNASRQVLRDLADDKNKRARRTLDLAEESTQLINTFAIANLMANVLVAAVVTTMFVEPLSLLIVDVIGLSVQAALTISLFLVMGITMLVITIFSEVIPVTLVQHNTESWAMQVTPVVRLLMQGLAPLAAVLTAIRRVLVTWLGEPTGMQVTEEAIMTLVDAGEEEGSIEQEEKRMIYSIFQLDETLVREIMVPRIDVIAVDVNTPLLEALDVIQKAGYSRIPVFEESLDSVRGLLYAKDLLSVLQRGENDTTLAGLLRQALFVPETKKVMDLLRELQTAKVQMAIVIDEYGGTAGLATMEDVVEEIVGEIFDEYDEDEEVLHHRVNETEHLVDARIHLDDFNELLDVQMPDELGDTLGGFIYGQLGKVPEPGENFEAENLYFEVISVIDRRIRKVRVIVLPGAEEEVEEGRGRTNGNGNTAGR